MASKNSSCILVAIRMKGVEGPKRVFESGSLWGVQCQLRWVGLVDCRWVTQHVIHAQVPRHYHKRCLQGALILPVTLARLALEWPRDVAVPLPSSQVLLFR